jgi:hypothetical protein
MKTEWVLTFISAGAGMLSLIVATAVEVIKRLGDDNPLRRILHLKSDDGPPRP